MNSGPPSVPNHATVALQLWLQRTPLRLTPLWAFLAGMWLQGGLQLQLETLVRVLAALFVVDMLWGAVWQQLHNWTTLAAPAPSAQTVPPLPYAQPAAPFSRIWRWLSQEPHAARGRDAWLAWLMALLISAWLSPLAVLATAFSAVLALLSTASLLALPVVSRALGAVASVALPWWLGMNLFADGAGWRWPDAAHAQAWSLMLVFSLMLFFNDHRQKGGSQLWQWGSGALLDIIVLVYSGAAAALAVAVVLVIALGTARRSQSLWLEMGQWLALLLAVGL